MESSKFMLPRRCLAGHETGMAAVIPMLKCYMILVLVRSLDGFDAALATLDKLMVRPERIAFETSLGAIDLNVGRRKVLDMRGAHFDPPRECNRLALF
jgi:hypothetical protein